MKAKAIVAVMMVLISIVAVLASFTLSVLAEGTVYIDSDYTFTSDIYEQIVVVGDNLVIDGAGRTLQGFGVGFGIFLDGRKNVTIKNVRITGFQHAIALSSSEEILLIENKIEHITGDIGIRIGECHHNKVINNTLSNNEAHSIWIGNSSYNIFEGNNASYNFCGISLGSSSNNTIINNVASHNSHLGIYVDSDSFNNVVSNNTANYNGFCGIEVARNSNDNTITDNTVVGNLHGVMVHFASSNNTLARNVVISNLDRGICIVDSSSFSKVYQNSVIDNLFMGIDIGDSHHNTVFNNTLSNSSMHICNSSHNLIEGNNLSYDVSHERSAIDVTVGSSNNTIVNNVAYYLFVHERSDNNIIVGNEIEGELAIEGDANDNMISNNYLSRIKVSNSSGNLIYHNNIIALAQIYSYGPMNVWDDGYPSGGNYWSDYAGVDSNYDGIGDTVYAIDGNNIDTYPLMGMFSDFNTTSEHHIQTVCNSSLSNFGFNGTVIMFDVAGENNTAGFCRICIPTDLINETYRIFVNRTEVQYSTLSCSNTTHKYLYFNYTHPSEKVLIINTDWYKANALTGDVNRDMKVDMEDLVTAATSFGSHSGDPKWNPYSDVTGDGTVNIKDIVTITRHFGEHYP